MVILAKPPKRGPKPKQRIARGKRPRQKSKNPLPKLREKLWGLFSRYIKDRDGNRCFTCDHGGLEGVNWHAGHMFPSGQSSLLRYDPNNVHPQCYHCNINLGGNGAVYATNFIERFGWPEFRRLLGKARASHKWTRPELQELIKTLEMGGADYECFYAEHYGL